MWRRWTERERRDKRSNVTNIRSYNVSVKGRRCTIFSCLPFNESIFAPTFDRSNSPVKHLMKYVIPCSMYFIYSITDCCTIALQNTIVKELCCCLSSRGGSRD